MKKLVAMGTMVVLMLAAASPAFAQTVTATAGDDALAANFQVVDASQSVSATTTQTGDATAVADDGSAAFAYNDLYVDVYQFNQGLGGDFGYYFYY